MSVIKQGLLCLVLSLLIDMSFVISDYFKSCPISTIANGKGVDPIMARPEKH